MTSRNMRTAFVLFALFLCFPSPCLSRTRQARAVAGARAGAYVEGVAAKLSPAQVRKLLLLRSPIAVPTYIPAGFRVADVSGERDTKTAPNYAIVVYRITYRGPRGRSFSIEAANEGIGDMFLSTRTLKGSNPYFEHGIEVGYMDDDANGSPEKTVASQWIGSRRQYQVTKGDDGGQNYHLEATGITPREALRIMESLRYLKR